MTRLDLVEGGPAVEVALDDHVGAALAASEVVDATPTLVGGIWRVAPRTSVGVARVAGIEVWVKPKLPVRRLLFLLGYAVDGQVWRDEDVGVAEERDLLSAVAGAFVRQAARAVEMGLLQGYRVEEAALPVLRGRLRTDEQLTRRFGMAVPLEVRYDEFDVDIAENQLLRGAVEVLLRLPGVDAVTRQRLRRLLRTLADVTPARPGLQLPSWRPTRLNSRYHLAVRLAEVVLRGSSVEQATGVVRVNGFLLNMAKLYEDFVVAALGQALTAYGGIAARQPVWKLDEAGRVVIEPDLVWTGDDGRLRAVVDAKYKEGKPSGFPNADLYQMSAYCTASGLPRGHLVYARGGGEARTHVMRGSGLEVVQHTLDLDQAPGALLAGIGDLARTVAGVPHSGPSGGPENGQPA